MCSSGKTFALLFVLLFATSWVLIPTVTVKATSLQGDKTYFSLPDYNASIIILNGTSYGQAQYYPAHTNHVGYYPSLWDFPMLSTGNGTTDLQISANDCNVTITSYNYQENPDRGYQSIARSWLNYTVTGTGSQYLDYSTLLTDIMGNSSLPMVYIDGVLKRQGDSWNWTANVNGITVNGAKTKVSIYQENLYFSPPRNAQHLEPCDYVISIVAVMALVILLLFRRHRKTAKLNQ